MKTTPRAAGIQETERERMLQAATIVGRARERALRILAACTAIPTKPGEDRRQTQTPLAA